MDDGHAAVVGTIANDVVRRKVEAISEEQGPISDEKRKIEQKEKEGW
jgi:hypothetical protein